MKKIIGKFLSEQFRPSKIIKNAWETEDFGIIRYIWLDKSNFHPNGKSWYLGASVDFKSNYGALLDHRYPIIDVSVKDSEILSKENMSLLSHWDEGEEAEIGKAIQGTLLPWLESMGKPEVFADFLSRSIVIGTDGKDAEHEMIFGDVIRSLRYNSPRVRKLNFGYLATIYERSGRYEEALNSLREYKVFFAGDVFQNMKPSEIESREVVAKSIDDGILRLEKLI